MEETVLGSGRSVLGKASTSAPAPNTQHLTPEQLKFLQLVAPPALRSQASYGIPAAVTIAQAILESGWGRSKLFTQANNPFGIKHRHSAGGEEYGEYVAETTEFEAGIPHTELAVFARFPDLESAFQAHARLFWRLARYAAAIAARRDWRAFADALGPRTNDQDRAHGGYSTDPLYAAKLKNLARACRLDDRRALAWYATGRDPASEKETGNSKLETGTSF